MAKRKKANRPRQGPPKTHPLDELLKVERGAVRAFARERPYFSGSADVAIAAARSLISVAVAVSSDELREALWLMLWQSVLEYQRHALQATVVGEVGIGYTLLRNATELSRDIACIKTDQDAERWREGKRDNRRDGSFRFDESDPAQAYVHEVYKEASAMGTHGHFSLMQFGEVYNDPQKLDHELKWIRLSLSSSWRTQNDSETTPT